MRDARSSPSEVEKAGGRVVLWMLVGLCVLFGGIYVALYVLAGDKVPQGATVAGVEIGGLPHDEAVRELRQELGDVADQPLRVRVGGSTAAVRPARAGLAVDYEASVEQVGGRRSWSPAWLWRYFTGGEDTEAVVRVRDARLDAMLGQVEQQHGTPPRDGAVGFRDGEVRVRQPRVGRVLDRDAAREALRGAYPTGDEVSLDLVDAPPEIDQEDVRSAVEEVARPALAGPVVIGFEDVRVRLSPEQYAPALALVAEDGELVPTLREGRLHRVVRRQLGAKGEPQPATVRLVDGQPQVVPGKAGVTYDRGELEEVFWDLVTRDEGERRARVAAETVRPDFTRKDAAQLGITEQVSTFTTSYPHAEYRNVNLGRAAEIIDGTVLKPGETFSLNDTVGERTRVNGFTAGTIIRDGVYTEELGGGVSQMATTLFNAMYFAGLEDVEHRPHSFYIDRYPVGREATVVWGALDLKFRNDTEHGVLITSGVDPSSPGSRGELTVTMYSTTVWDISSTKSERYDFTQPGTQTSSSPECIPQEGRRGFDIDVTRIFRRPGEQQVHHRETFHTTYEPSDEVDCQ